MLVLNRVLRYMGLARDDFFKACNVDLNTVSLDHSRQSEFSQLVQAIKRLPPEQQDRLHNLAQRLDSLTTSAAQELLEDLNIHRGEDNKEQSPFDTLMTLYQNSYDIFCKIEAIFHTENFPERVFSWDGYRLPSPIPLPPTTDLNEFKSGLKVLFRETPFVIKTYRSERLNRFGAPVSSVLFMIYRRGFPTLVETVSEKQDDVDNKIIFPARLYSIMYEPATGIMHLHGRVKEIRDGLRKLFCKTVLDSSNHPDTLFLLETQLNLLRIPIDLASRCSVKYGLEKIAVKHIHGVLLPENEPMDFGAKPKAPFTSDVYNALRKQRALHLLQNKNLLIQSATLALCFHQEGCLPAECIEVTLKAPNGCSLPHNNIRDKYILNELLVESGLIREVSYA